MCRDKRYDDCPAKIHVSVETVQLSGAFTTTTGSDAARIEAAKVVAGVKRRCEENQELPGQLVATALQNVSEAVMGKLPSTQAIKKSINRLRNKFGAVPANPLTCETWYYCPDEDTRELYVLADSGAGDDRVIIFGRETSAHWALGT